MNTLQLAKLETQLGFKLKAVNSIEAILDDNATKSYLCNEQDELIGINLHYCGLSDLSAILPFKNLIALNISGNSLNSLDGIEGLLNLSYLKAGSNDIEDITGIEPLKNLIHLDFFNIKAKSIDFLADMLNLEYLDIDLDTITVQDLNPIKALLKLKYIRLNWILGGDFSALGCLENLEVLIIHRPKDILFVEKLNKLRKIELRFVHSIGSELLNLDRIEFISLESCSLKTTAFLRNKKNLSHLELTSCKFNSIADLKELSSLKYLSLRANSIKDIQPLEQLSNLVYLDLSSNPIDNINCLASLQQLEILELANTKIKNISVLRELRHLTVLDLNINKNIIDYSPLEPFTQFKYLGVEHGNYQLALSEELKNEFHTNFARALDTQNYDLCIDLLYKFKHSGGRGDEAFDIYMSIRENHNIDTDDKHEDKIDFWDEVGDLTYGYTNVVYKIWWDYNR